MAACSWPSRCGFSFWLFMCVFAMYYLFMNRSGRKCFLSRHRSAVTCSSDVQSRAQPHRPGFPRRPRLAGRADNPFLSDNLPRCNIPLEVDRGHSARRHARPHPERQGRSMPIRPANQPRAAHDVTHDMRRVLRLVISLLLVFCTPSVVHDYGIASVPSFEQRSKTDHFAPSIAESTIGSVDLVQRTNPKSSDRTFCDAVIPDQVPIVSILFLTFSVFEAIDRFVRKIGFKAISSRAPPRSIF